MMVVKRKISNRSVAKLKRSKRSTSKADECKSLQLKSIAADTAASISSSAGTFFSNFGKFFTAGATIALHTTKAALDLTMIAKDCSSIPFDEIKELMDKKFNEMDRKLDKNFAAMQKISEVVGQTLSAIEDTRIEMQQKFDTVLNSIKSSRIEPVVTKINNFVQYFETEKSRFDAYSTEEYIFNLEHSGYLNYLRDSRTPKGDSLQTSLYEIISQNFATPEDASDELAFSALYALFYGMRTYVEVMYFLIDKYAYLASFYYQKNELEKFNRYFNFVKMTFNDFRYSFLRSSKSGSAIDAIIDAYENVKSIDLDGKQYDTVVNYIDDLRGMKHNITTMDFPMIVETPVNSITASFDNNVDTQFGNWKEGSEVRYAMQYKYDDTYSKVSDWTESISVKDRGYPTLKIPIDLVQKPRLIYRKFENQKPELVGIIEYSQTTFRDVDRDLFNAAGSTNEVFADREIEILLSQGANINAAFEGGICAIHEIARQGNSKLAERFFLKEETIDLNVKDKRGYTPLHFAAEFGQSEFIKLLSDSKVEKNTKTKDENKTALHLAAEKGYAETVGELLKINVNPNEKSKGGFTSLHSAIKGGLNVVQKLIVFPNIEIDAKSDTGLTPFHLAVISGNKELVQIFLDQPVVDVNAADERNGTALHSSCMVRNLDMVQFLLDQPKIDVNFQATQRKWTPLHAACMSESPDVALQLLNNDRINIDVKDDAEATPLHLCVAKGMKDVVFELLKKNASVNVKTINGYTPFHFSAMRGNVEIMSVLKSKSDESIDIETNDGKTALHLAAANGRFEAVKWLIDQRANVNNYDKDGNLFIYYAVRNGHLDIVTYCVDNAKININLKDSMRTDKDYRDGSIALYAMCDAVRFGQIEVVKYFVGSLNKVLCNPMVYAATFGHFDIVKYLFEEAKLDFIRSGDTTNGTLPLSKAVKNDHLNIVKYLKEKGVDINLTSYLKTPLQVAVDSNRANIVDYLVKNNANMNIKDDQGNTLLHLAVPCHYNVLKYLLTKSKINVNEPNKYNVTVLHKAYIKNDSKAVSLLYSKGGIIIFSKVKGDFERNNEPPFDSCANTDRFRRSVFTDEEDESNDFLLPSSSLFKIVEKNSVGSGLTSSQQKNLDYGLRVVIPSKQIFPTDEEDKSNEFSLPSNPIFLKAENNSKVESALDSNQPKHSLGWPYAAISSNQIVPKQEMDRSDDFHLPSNHHFEKADTNFHIESSLASNQLKKPFDWLYYSKSAAYTSNENFHGNDISKSKISGKEAFKYLGETGTGIFNSTLFLLDVMLKKLKGEKYNNHINASTDPSEEMAQALEISQQFEKYLDSYGNSYSKDKIDFSRLFSDVLKAVKSEKQGNIFQMLQSYLKKAKVKN